MLQTLLDANLSRPETERNLISLVVNFLNARYGLTQSITDLNRAVLLLDAIARSLSGLEHNSSRSNCLAWLGWMLIKRSESQSNSIFVKDTVNAVSVLTNALALTP